MPCRTSTMPSAVNDRSPSRTDDLLTPSCSMNTRSGGSLSPGFNEFVVMKSWMAATTNSGNLPVRLLAEPTALAPSEAWVGPLSEARSIVHPDYRR
jgi:hypothetical protein